METTPIRKQIYEFIELYVDTPEPKKLCSSIEDLVEELADSKVKNLILSGVSSALPKSEKLLESIICADRNVIDDFESSDVVIRDLHQQCKELLAIIKGND